MWSSSPTSQRRQRHRWSPSIILHSQLLQIVQTLLLLSMRSANGQTLNQPPHFVPGSGDMSRFSLLENTPVGSPVYQLRGKLIRMVDVNL
ncbi:unnamed protein product [Ceratitis capitata]|uniref:(Mediterranean fruit fly) hypothetical protein n=1 Tax=Ceratitis capitata TaxID=7213 RepID=A0A811UZT0_CERCA|nr:unnamed protein product [Ceratitis capitata]